MHKPPLTYAEKAQHHQALIAKGDARAAAEFHDEHIKTHQEPQAASVTGPLSLSNPPLVALRFGEKKEFMISIIEGPDTSFFLGWFEALEEGTVMAVKEIERLRTRSAADAAANASRISSLEDSLRAAQSDSENLRNQALADASRIGQLEDDLRIAQARTTTNNGLDDPPRESPAAGATVIKAPDNLPSTGKAPGKQPGGKAG